MQLELFPTRRDPPRAPPQWERLSQDERTQALKALARVLAKTVRPEAEGQHHER